MKNVGNRWAYGWVIVFCNDFCILRDKNPSKTITEYHFLLPRLDGGATNIKLLRSFWFCIPIPFVILGGFVSLWLLKSVFWSFFFYGFGNYKIVVNVLIFCNNLCILRDKNPSKTITSLQFLLTRLADGAINMKLLWSFEVW